jgi:exopolyphosphatase/guanosine-5'-triphosphate,3'-diphosphate pyrophosphatase
MTILRLATNDGPYRSPRDDAGQRIAAIDIGSNSIRQIVAEVSANGAIRVVDEMKAAPRLGSGLGGDNVLGDEPMRLAIESLVRMATLARQLGAKRIEAVATSAVRDATNGGAFLARVRQEAGLRVRLLNGEEEARLAFRSALAHFELGAVRAVVMDIGGGSLELAASADGLVERLRSLPFGALRLTERFLGAAPTEKDVRKLRKYIRSDIEKALPLRDWRGAEVIGSGGTFTNLAGIFLARQGMHAARSVHGTRIPRVEVEHVLEMLQQMTPAERLTVPGLNAGRADIIIAGLAVAAEVLARVEPRELSASAFGIREGLLLEVARVNPTVADPGVARERSVREFAERCRFEGAAARASDLRFDRGAHGTDAGGPAYPRRRRATA